MRAAGAGDTLVEPPLLSLETYRARFGPAAVSVLALAAAAGVLLVLLPEQWQRIVVASVAWAAGLGIAIGGKRVFCLA